MGSFKDVFKRVPHARAAPLALRAPIRVLDNGFELVGLHPRCVVKQLPTVDVCLCIAKCFLRIAVCPRSPKQQVVPWPSARAH